MKKTSLPVSTSTMRAISIVVVSLALPSCSGTKVLNEPQPMHKAPTLAPQPPLASGGDDPVTMAVERHRIHRPKVRWVVGGTSEKHIDDWAVVNRKVGGTSFTRNYSKFSVDVVTSDGATLHVKGKLHHKRNAVESDQGLLGWYIEERTGISSIGPDAPYRENLSASITAGDSSGETWEFSAQKHYVPGQIILPSGTVTNGVRTLNIKSRVKGPRDLGRFVEIYEDGDWLFQWASERGDEYVFRAGLDPQLKLLLLASMEAFWVRPWAARGPW